jgi:ABC-type transport system involved in cytochrome c biogenesis permease subunit
MNELLLSSNKLLCFGWDSVKCENVFAIYPLDISAYVYLFACLTFFVAVSRSGVLLKKRSESDDVKVSKSLKFSIFLSLLAFGLHTLGMAGRWYIGGLDRPPWTNLYESLVGFAWMLSLFQVLALRKFRLALVGAISSPLIFLLMGMSVMTPDKTVAPLVPALQSHWLKIHVLFGMISYAGFTMAACFAFFFLIKAKVSMSKIAVGLSLMTILNLGMVGGNEYFETGHFYMANTVQQKLDNGKTVWVKERRLDQKTGAPATVMKEVPDVHILLHLSFAFFALAALGLAFYRKRGGAQDFQRRSFFIYLTAVLMMTLFFVVVNIKITSIESLRWQANPYLLMLLLMTVFINALFVGIAWNYKGFTAALPSQERLDELSYKNILFAFPFQALLLVTGAIWAYSAWGRSWGWDPKETWALITWFAYLIYLHGKLLLRWNPVYLAVISLMGFVIMVFAFLGVNLVLSGLHSYGAA